MTPQTLENSMNLFSVFRSLILWIHFIYNIIYLRSACVLSESNRTACTLYIQHWTLYNILHGMKSNASNGSLILPFLFSWMVFFSVCRSLLLFIWCWRFLFENWCWIFAIFSNYVTIGSIQTQNMLFVHTQPNQKY